MTTTNTIIGLQRNAVHTPHKAATAACTQEYEWVPSPNTAQCTFLGLHYVALDEIVENPAGKGEDKRRFSLQNILIGLREILFHDRGREAYRRLEGDDVTPITAYKSGNRYYVADGGNALATARYLGQAYILAEVWELP